MSSQIDLRVAFVAAQNSLGYNLFLRGRRKCPQAFRIWDRRLGPGSREAESPEWETGDREAGKEELKTEGFLTLIWTRGAGSKLHDPFSGSWLLRFFFARSLLAQGTW